MKPIAKPQTDKKTFRLSYECLDTVEYVQKNLQKTIKEFIAAAVKKNCEFLTPKIFKIIMDEEQDASDIGFIVNSHIGGSKHFRKDYYDIKDGGRPVEGKTFVIAPETEKSLELLKNTFGLNQSKTLELTLRTYHRMLHIEEHENANKRLPINEAITERMKTFLKDVEAAELDLFWQFTALKLAKPSTFFSEKYDALVTSRQHYGLYNDIHQELVGLDVFEIYDNEKALQNGMDMLEKAILNFMVIRNITSDILQDCEANLISIKESIKDGEDLISELSK